MPSGGYGRHGLGICEAPEPAHPGAGKCACSRCRRLRENVGAESLFEL